MTSSRIAAASIIVATFLIAGCATQPISNSEASPVPADQILTNRFSAQLPNTGEVVIKRDSGIGGSVCSSRIFVDGIPIANVAVSEKLVLYIPKGEHIFSARPNGICGGGLSEVKSSIGAGTVSTFRVGYGSNGDFFINPTAF